MLDIWPSRVINLPRQGKAPREDWLPAPVIDQINRTIIKAKYYHHNQLDRPVVLNSGTMRLIGLIQIGEDDITGSTLLLRVTEEGLFGNNPLIRLLIMTYSSGQPTSRVAPPRLSPSGVGDLLDTLKEQLHAIVVAAEPH